MATIIKRKLEHMRQSFSGSMSARSRSSSSGGGAPVFKPTCNARNTSMLQEASTFAGHLRTLHRDLADLARRYDGSMAIAHTVLSALLPRVYEPVAADSNASSNSNDSPAVAPVGEPVLVGKGMDMAAIASLGPNLRLEQQNEVLKHIEGWLSALQEIQKKHRKVGNICLDLDAQRRTVQGLTERSNRVSSAGGSEDKDLTRKLMEEEVKMQRLQQRFTEKEAEVHAALIALVQDMAQVKVHVANAMALYQEAFATVRNAICGTMTAAPKDDHPAPTSQGSPKAVSSGGAAESNCSSCTSTHADPSAEPSAAATAATSSPPPAQQAQRQQQESGSTLQLTRTAPLQSRPVMNRSGLSSSLSLPVQLPAYVGEVPSWYSKAKLMSTPLNDTGSDGSSSDEEESTAPDANKIADRIEEGDEKEAEESGGYSTGKEEADD